MLFVFSALLSFSQELPNNCIEEYINKKVSECISNEIDQTTALNLFLSYMHIRSEGKSGMAASLSSIKFQLDTNVDDELVSIEKKNALLNEIILKSVTYKDSVAAIVTINNNGWFLLNFTWIENDKWVNGGQGVAFSERETDSVLQVNLPYHYKNLKRIASVASVPSETRLFVDFLKEQTKSPEEFLINQLKSHKLVINGEIHRRKVNWEMLRRVISNKEFKYICGTIFMELPSWHQAEMDEFLFNADFKPELILKIFRDEQIHGWWDKGEFDFICDLWKINHSLSEAERISIKLVDYQVPYSRILSINDYKKALENVEARDTHMADMVEKYITSAADDRNFLFIVGLLHAFNNTQLYSTVSVSNPKSSILNAGTQLKQRLGSSSVFTVFQHCLSTDNGGNHKSPLRGMVFDMAFAANNNRPLGFSLKDSPFGKEPFDALYEYKYQAGGGTYQDNFDGYIFLCPLSGEQFDSPLYVIFDNDFIDEMKRRAKCFGLENNKDFWFGFRASEITKERILQRLQN